MSSFSADPEYVHVGGDGMSDNEYNAAVENSMFGDEYPPTGFNQQQWDEARDKLFNAAVGVERSKPLSRKMRCYRAALAMKRLETYYRTSLRMCAISSREVAEPACYVLVPPGGKKNGKLVATRDKKTKSVHVSLEVDAVKDGRVVRSTTLNHCIAALDAEEGFPKDVVSALHVLRTYGNIHEGLPDLKPHLKPQIAQAMFLVACTLGNWLDNGGGEGINPDDIPALFAGDYIRREYPAYESALTTLPQNITELQNTWLTTRTQWLQKVALRDTAKEQRDRVNARTYHQQTKALETELKNYLKQLLAAARLFNKGKSLLKILGKAVDQAYDDDDYDKLDEYEPIKDGLEGHQETLKGRTDVVICNGTASLNPIRQCSVSDLKNAGFDAKELKNAGFSAAELKSYYSLADLVTKAKFPLVDLRQANFTVVQLKPFGFRYGEMHNAGYSEQECIAAGYSSKFGCKQTLTGHNNYVYTIAILDENTFVSGSADSTIKVWRKATNGQFKCVETLTGHTDFVYTIAILDENTFVSGSYDKTIKVWRKATDGQFACEQTLTEHTNCVHTVAILDENTFVSGSAENTIKVWRKATNGQFVSQQTLTGHTESVYALAILDENTFVSGSVDNTIKVWRKATNGQFKCEQSLTGHTKWVNTVAILDENTFVSGSFDNTIIVWRKATNGQFVCKETLTEHNAFVYTIAILAANTFVSGSGDKTIKVWRKATNGQFVCEQTLTGNTYGVYTVAILDENTFVSGCHRTIKVWSL
eukprot:g301.t1